MNRDYIIPLSDQRANLDTVGGKGASLARLCRADLPVPDGFHISTAAYSMFVTDNALQPFLMETVNSADVFQPATLEAASRAIQTRFVQGHIPECITRSIVEAYKALSGDLPVVAVRSSATAEDLPEASFAGQQETFLNICGVEALLDAVKRCWASLWTARAIAYRTKNHIDHSSVALAVVVQELVFADAAGILFTANPFNGHRDEILINAAWGLGEAVVSGAVTPDGITVEKTTGKILKRVTAEKMVMTVRTKSGTQETAVPAALKKKPVLNNAQVVELARLGERIEALYGIPMDVEWALARGKFAVLQARPITTLPPEWTRPHPKAIYARGSLAEHLPNPVTPLFATLGLRAVNKATAEFASLLNLDAAEAEYQYRAINGYVFMGFITRPGIFWKMIMGSFPALKTIFGNTKESWLASSRRLAEVMARWESAAGTTDDLQALSTQELLAGVDEVFTQSGRLYTVLQSTTLPAATSSEVIFSQVYRLARRKGDPEATAFLFGFDTVPMKAEKALFDLAFWIKGQPDVADTIHRLPSPKLAAMIGENILPEGISPEVWAECTARFAAYLQTFGATAYEFDFSNPTPAETLAPVLDAIKMYLNGQGHNPHQRQRAAIELREQAEQRIMARLRWPLKGWYKKSLKWAQSAGPVREDCLIDLGKANPLVRKLLGELGRRLAAGGAIETADDIYWLEEKEVISLCDRLENGDHLPDLRGAVLNRKAGWRAQLKLTPPAMLPERSGWAKMIPWHKTDQVGNTLKGMGASAGKVTAPACVLLSPSDFDKMKPGAVLVAVTTTPAWTPLFAMAAAVVTDIGGPLSHSSIVAREYGIPAVMAVGLATRRIQDGQIITVDGSAGLVILQSDES